MMYLGDFPLKNLKLFREASTRTHLAFEVIHRWFLDLAQTALAAPMFFSQGILVSIVVKTHRPC